MGLDLELSLGRPLLGSGMRNDGKVDWEIAELHVKNQNLHMSRKLAVTVVLGGLFFFPSPQVRDNSSGTVRILRLRPLS